jgi:DNA-binding CsgD family transcriptional regulator
MAQAWGRPGTDRGTAEPGDARDPVGPPLAERITPREREILGLLARGAATKEIAAGLHIAPNTVRSHVQSLLVKLEVNSRIRAVALAIRHGLADPRWEDPTVPGAGGQPPAFRPTARAERHRTRPFGPLRGVPQVAYTSLSARRRES